MSWIQKTTTTRYVKNDRRVPKGTKGARKVTEESAKYYGFWRENGKLCRIPLSTDKVSAKKLFDAHLTRLEREKAGVIDKSLGQLTRPIEEHLTDFLAQFKLQGNSSDYEENFEYRLRAVVGDAKNLVEFDEDHITAFLDGMTERSARTKETYRAAASVFCNWLMDQDRLEKNPLRKVVKPAGKAVRKRRALSVPELQKLLDVTRTRPVKEFSTIRIGPRKGQVDGKLKPETRKKLEMLGLERSLIYKMAIYTGLRRGEIEALRVEHLQLEAKPYAWLNLPGEFTKNGDEARLLLIPSFASELVEWIKLARKTDGDLLFAVRNEMVKTLRADLRAADIPYKDNQGRQADFHALRMSCNVMLGQAGVSPRVRQLAMRHGDIRLTLDTYDDSAMADMSTAVVALEKAGLK